MNPFQVLGVGPDAPPDEIELTYRRLLRAHHPDLHQGADPAELAEAEQRTRELNQAMALIRAGWRPRADVPGGFRFDDRPRSRASWPPPRGAPASDQAPPPRRGSWEDAFATGPDTDWFGHRERPHRRVDSVECPLCGTAFDDAAVLRTHLGAVHQLRDGDFGDSRRPRRHPDWFYWLRWIPVPQLTLTALLFVYLAVVDGLVPAPWTVPSLWLGFALYVLAMAKALSKRRTA